MNKKQQIMHIHGGNVFNNYEDYLSYLKNVDVKINFSQTSEERWYKKYHLYLDQEKFQIIKPIMPSKFNAKYEEWKIWFERHFHFLENNVVLVGHSLGGNFLVKYLSENKFPFYIKQLHIISSPYNYTEKNKHALNSVNFKLINSPEKIYENTIEEIHIYHSTDDTVVPISESKKYHKILLESHFHVFNDRFHFLNETFPELFEIIKKSQ